MTPLTLAALRTLPAAVDQTDGSPFGMNKAMALIVLVAIAVLVVIGIVDTAVRRRRPPEPPSYPILAPPGEPEDARR